MRTTEDETVTWMLRDAGEVLRVVLERHHLATGDLLVVAVHHPSTDQQVLDAVRIPCASWDTSEERERSELLCRVANAMPIPQWSRPGPIETVLITVVLREGLPVVDSHDAEIFRAWRYSNHLTGALDTTLVLVTEHGWLDALSGRGGAEPRWDGTRTAVSGRVVPLTTRRARRLRGG